MKKSCCGVVKNAEGEGLMENERVLGKDSGQYSGRRIILIHFRDYYQQDGMRLNARSDDGWMACVGSLLRSARASWIISLNPARYNLPTPFW